jgi:hypothetical protein
MESPDPEIVPARQGEPPESTERVYQPAKLIRIVAMIREVLEDVRQSSPDEGGRKRLREIYERTRAELKDALSEDLQHELETLTMPLDPNPSESELRVAKAQLLGWLEGLFHGIQAALWSQQMQARAQLQEMRRRGLPPGAPPGAEGPRPGQYL